MSARAEAGDAAGVASELPASVLVRVFLRSLLLQASWNRRGMQNLGVAYALWPALERLYPDPGRRAAAAARHLAFFNTHPYLAPAILGGALRHEVRVARGEEPAEAVERFKAALMGPFAAVGDSFFWLSLRPFAGMWAALLAPWIGLWAVALFLVLYNVPHLILRVRLFVAGWRGGDRVVEQVARAGLPKWGARLRRTSAVGGGAAVVVGVHLLTGPGLPVEPARWLAVASFAALVVFFGTWALLARRGAHWAAFAAVLLGIGLAFAGAGW